MKKNRITQSMLSTLLLLMLFIFVGSCKKDSTNKPGANEVYIENMEFTPSVITVSLNATVTWINNDGMAHTVTSDTDLFDSGSIADGGTYQHTFATAGTYPYKCSYHSSMTGTVVVNP